MTSFPLGVALPGAAAFLASRAATVAARKIGILTNDAATVGGESTLDAVCAVFGARMARILTPEHGLAAAASAAEPVADSTYRGLPVVSLYGTADPSRPPLDALVDLDLLLIDLPDIGTRFYTYASTALLCVHAAAECGLPVCVLDRPNPLGGDTVEGPSITEGYHSFIGIAPVPIRHGMTLGELLLFLERESTHAGGFRAARPHGAVEVVRAEGWRRSMMLEEAGLPWVSPSPAIRGWRSVLLYPATCLFEALRVSVGRGTPCPFEQLGAPGIDGAAWTNEARRYAAELGIWGVTFDSHSFQPTADLFCGELCGGIHLTVTERRAWQPVRSGLLLLAALIATHGSEALFRTYRAAGRERWNLDLYYGSPALRRLLFGGPTPRALAERISHELVPFEQSFEVARRPYLLYR